MLAQYKRTIRPVGAEPQYSRRDDTCGNPQSARRRAAGPLAEPWLRGRTLRGRRHLCYPLTFNGSLHLLDMGGWNNTQRQGRRVFYRPRFDSPAPKLKNAGATSIEKQTLRQPWLKTVNVPPRAGGGVLRCAHNGPRSHPDRPPASFLCQQRWLPALAQ